LKGVDVITGEDTSAFRTIKKRRNILLMPEKALHIKQLFKQSFFYQQIG
jgi:hypothetical protein